MARDVIFVPGLPGSELFETGPQGDVEKIFVRIFRLVAAILWRATDPRLLGPDNLQAPDPVFAGDPVESTKILLLDVKRARSLYDLLLAECGLPENRIHKVGYDWRRPVSDPRAATALTTAIQNAPVGSVLIAHSTGGLVARAVLEGNPALCQRLSAVLGFGVPWLGTLKPLAILFKKASLTAADSTDARRIMAHSWAGIDLLPRPNAGLTVKGNGQPFDLFASPGWLPATPLFLRQKVGPRLAHSMATIGTPSPNWQLPVDLHNVMGFGARTTVSARITTSAVELDVTSGGGALTFDELRHGDGTAPFASVSAISNANRVKHWVVPIGAYRSMAKKVHGSLWLNPGAIKALRHVVGQAPRDSLTELALDTSAYSPGQLIRLRYSVQDSNGDPSQGLIRILTPGSGQSQTTFGTDGSGFGTLPLPRSAFHKFTQGQSDRRRVKAELENLSDGSKSDIFALVPA